MAQPSLNGPCPCGSGKKFKRCCGAGGRTDLLATLQRLASAAIAAFEAGDMHQADRLVDQALARAPGDPGLLGIKGMVSFRLGKLDDGCRQIERALAGNPRDSRLHNFHGQILAEYGNNPSRIEAERAFGTAVSLDPGFVEAWYNLGRVQLTLSKPHEAILSFTQAERHAPNDPGLQFHLAKARYLMRESAAAAAAIEKARASGFDPTLAKLWLAQIRHAQGHTEDAERLAREVLADVAAGPDLYPLLTDLGQSAMSAGDMAMAERWLRQAIELVPENPSAYLALATAHKFADADLDLLARIEAFLPASQGILKRRLEFSLGKAYTDLGRHDEAFVHFKAGNDLMRRAVPFDAHALVAKVDAIIARSTSDRLAGFAPGSDSDLPILIVGTPRSGTTLTEQIISSHSQVAGAGEMEFWGRIAPGLMSAYSPEQAKLYAQHYLAQLRRHSDTALRVTDKQPLNYEHLDVIHAVFPNAKIVHCRRHPIDACLSIYFQNFDDSQAYKCDQEGLVAYYEQYQRLMTHWRSVLPAGVMYELQYEALVDDFEAEARKLMAFLGLEWEAGQADFHKQDRTVFTPSMWQVRQPIYRTSKERWRRYEKHLGPLLELLKYA